MKILGNIFTVLFALVLISLVLGLLLVPLSGISHAQDALSPTGENLSLLDAAGDSFSFEIPATNYKDRLQAFSEMLFRLIYNLAYLPIAAPLVQALVQLTKRFTSDTVNARLLNLLFTVMAFAVWIAANEMGYGGQFESVLSGLGTMGISLLGIGASATLSGKLYDSHKAQGIPFLGYSRTTVAA